MICNNDSARIEQLANEIMIKLLTQIETNLAIPSLTFMEIKNNVIKEINEVEKQYKKQYGIYNCIEKSKVEIANIYKNDDKLIGLNYNITYKF